MAAGVRRGKVRFMAIPAQEQQRAAQALRRHCDEVPPEVRHLVSKDFRFVRSDVELIERRPHYLERDRIMEHVVAKFRYNATRESWTLLWCDRHERWHTHQGFEDRRNFLPLLREVERDPTRIFWG